MSTHLTSDTDKCGSDEQARKPHQGSGHSGLTSDQKRKITIEVAELRKFINSASRGLEAGRIWAQRAGNLKKISSAEEISQKFRSREITFRKYGSELIHLVVYRHDRDRRPHSAIVLAGLFDAWHSDNQEFLDDFVAGAKFVGISLQRKEDWKRERKANRAKK